MKNKLLIFTKIIYVFIIAGLIPLFLLIKLVPDYPFTNYYVLVYVIVLLFCLFYTPILTVINSRKVKKEFLMKCLKDFALCFAVMLIFNGILDFMLNKFNFMHVLFQSLACAFGLSFIDIIFLKNNKLK